MALTKINNNTLSAITGLPAGVGGKVLQVVSSVLSTQASTTSDFGSTGIASGLKASITPSSTSSKIYIASGLSVLIDADGNQTNKIGKFGIKHNTGSSLLYVTRVGAKLSGADKDFFGNTSMNYLHSPNSTSSQEYEIVFGRWSATYNNTVEINDSGDFDSTITLMEIAG